MTEIAIAGTVRTTVLANLRVGAPSTQAAVGQKLPAGTAVSVAAVAAGEAVQGNPLWFRTTDQSYVWSGACGPLQVTGAVAVAGAPAVSAGFPTPFVVDLSHGDRVENLKAAKAAGLVGVIHKATTGATGRDDAYAARRQAALEAGLLWGAYHWGTAADITAQVDNFLSWAAADQKQWGDADAGVLVALDFERSVGDQMTLDGARSFCQQIEDRLKRKAVLYGGDLIKSSLGLSNDAYLGAHRLWLAQYDATPTPQRSWGDYWLWQYTDGESGPGSKNVPGIPGDGLGRLDCDYYNGTEAALRASWAG